MRVVDARQGDDLRWVVAQYTMLERQLDVYTENGFEAEDL